MNFSFKPNDLTSCSLTELKNLSRGSYLYSQGEQADVFYFVASGLIGLYHLLDNGKESLIRIYSKNEYLGYRTLFSQSHDYHCTAKVMQEANIIRITPKNNSFLEENSLFARELIAALSEELAHAEMRLANISYIKSLDRVLNAIRYLYTKYPTYDWTYKEIAEYAGCETETAIRLAKELKKTDLINFFIKKK